MTLLYAPDRTVQVIDVLPGPFRAVQDVVFTSTLTPPREERRDPTTDFFTGFIGYVKENRLGSPIPLVPSESVHYRLRLVNGPFYWSKSGKFVCSFTAVPLRVLDKDEDTSPDHILDPEIFRSITYATRNMESINFRTANEVLARDMEKIIADNNPVF